MLIADMKEDLLEKATALKVIPTVSNVVDRVLGIISNDESSFNDLTDVIKYDQAISSKIISIANSAYYSRGVQVFSLQRAIITIGFEEVKKIVMCLVFMNDILKRLKLKPQDMLDLWKHSALVACAARVLSKKMLVEEPQKVFTIALLHDIGKTVLYMSADNYHAMIKESEAKGKALEAMEKERFGIDHQEDRVCHRSQMAVSRRVPPCDPVSSRPQEQGTTQQCGTIGASGGQLCLSHEQGHRT